MPLLEVQCSSGHTSEVLKRGGASNGPFSCAICNEPAKRLWSGFGFSVQEVQYEAPPRDPDNKHAPEFIDRMGGGKAAKTSENLYRPAVTHNTKCVKEGKWRNMAILNDLGFAVRVCCEGCGYTWLHQQETAANPLREGVKNAYRPGKNYSELAPAGTGYEAPKRGL